MKINIGQVKYCINRWNSLYNIEFVYSPSNIHNVETIKLKYHNKNYFPKYVWSLSNVFDDNTVTIEYIGIDYLYLDLVYKLINKD